ncbi:MAG: nicotinate-nucleotide adenylyltransferase [Pseudomonadota bacterium]
MSVLPRLPGPYAGLRLGLFGGSFHPAHGGHRHVAVTALKRLGLDAVWWSVAAGNPLKSDHGPFQTRLTSARELAAHPAMRVTALEQAFGTRYTADLLARLMPRLAGARPVWIMGGDNLATFQAWGRWTQIAETLPLCIVARPGSSPRAGLSVFAQRYRAARLPEYAARALPTRVPPAWVYLKAPLQDISSSWLRAQDAPN